MGPQEVQELSEGKVRLGVGVSGAGQLLLGELLQLWVFGTCWTQTQGIASWIPSIRVILRSVGFSFCHKECDTGGSEDIGDDAGNK